jgi:hypothetical protein
MFCVDDMSRGWDSLASWVNNTSHEEVRCYGLLPVNEKEFQVSPDYFTAVSVITHYSHSYLALGVCNSINLFFVTSQFPSTLSRVAFIAVSNLFDDCTELLKSSIALL